MSTMKAIVIEKFGEPDVLTVKDVPKPEPKPGFVLIQVKAFGVNHAEMHMRKGEWAESMPISGIECVGVVEACLGNEFTPGTKVAALMGGLGRAINGSYAQYTLAPVNNVTKIDVDLPWETLAAIPESFATAWTCLFRNLELKLGQTLLIRGATSALGQAALKLAVNAGAKVSATSRNESRFPMLKAMGAAEVILEQQDLAQRLHQANHPKFDTVLNLVGNSVLLETLTVIRRGGRMCLAGFLGGLAPVADFNPLAQMASGVHFSFFGSFVFGTPEFPVSDVPLEDVVRDVAEGRLSVKPARVFAFEEIREAHHLMEKSQAGGKMVVVV
ncbi:hypothetical protein A1O3_06316 [Capronia epimyces CBS 606.96]|uniref:Enoyl reductase (ER) domain-containing protein n=1 Tax=Capronia epimyces CBS 606.96 TaxID=1182542 RepID=W9XQL8_9EURO|nr:uncharacterized protein A1O3_06316 [Capronia epimyces CBS 606.96]EXJ82503.1 hypothetical protein A1O3_06316 [Capronia epimyces CBS 606.96]